MRPHELSWWPGVGFLNYAPPNCALKQSSACALLAKIWYALCLALIQNSQYIIQACLGIYITVGCPSSQIINCRLGNLWIPMQTC